MARKNLRRKFGTRPRKKKFYILTEGKNTEPQYIQHYEKIVSSTTLDIVFAKKGVAPITLGELAVDKAREINRRSYIRENGSEDQVWIVFDRDEHDHLEKVFQICSAAGVQIAYSSPCFEVWLLLHYIDYDRSDNRYEVQKFCEDVCEGYRKDIAKIPDLISIGVKVEDAEARADDMCKRREDDGSVSPYTSVHVLTRAMRN